MKNKLVAIILLNYKNIDDSIECLESIRNISYDNYKVIIIDNASRDGSYEKLQELYPQHIIKEALDNRGYAAGNNIGIKIALDNKADYVCIVNNDIIVEKDFLNVLVEYMENHINVGIIGPKICAYNDHSIIQSTGASVNLNRGVVSIINGNYNADTISNNPINCDYVCGACMLVRTNVIRQIGLIPEVYFLFFEETEWCLKAKKEGYDVICLPTSCIYHKGSASVNKIEGLSFYYMSRNLVLFERRNGNLVNVVLFFFYTLLKLLYNLFRKKKFVFSLKAMWVGFSMDKRDFLIKNK